MRQILSMLREIRAERIKAAMANTNAPAEQINAKLAEVGDFFTYLDNGLSGRVGVVRLEETMMSGDFQYALGEFVQRLMVPGYTTKRFNFELFVKPDTTPNWMPVTRYQRRAGLDNLEFVGLKGEPMPGSVVDATKRQYQVYPWEKQYDFDRKALENDDLGYFTDLATEMGISARRTLEMYVSNFLWNAVIVARLLALGALYYTTGRLSTARISEARMAFNQRLDTRNVPINASLRYIVHHAGLVDTAAIIQRSTLIPETAVFSENVVRGTFTPVEDPYCAGTAPNLPWFAMTDWRVENIVPFVLARKNGVPAARIYRKKADFEEIGTILGPGVDVPPVMGDFATGNVVFKVSDVWGTYVATSPADGNMFDHRGCYYAAGTAM
jgi:hypothetical protein